MYAIYSSLLYLICSFKHFVKITVIYFIIFMHCNIVFIWTHCFIASCTICRLILLHLLVCPTRCLPFECSRSQTVTWCLVSNIYSFRSLSRTVSALVAKLAILFASSSVCHFEFHISLRLINRFHWNVFVLLTMDVLVRYHWNLISCSWLFL